MVPVHVDSAACAKRKEAVENPVTGHLDAPHWKDKVILSEHSQRDTRNADSTRVREMDKLDGCWITEWMIPGRSLH